MTTYTVESPAGDLIARQLTAREAMDKILCYDSHEYEIRPIEDGEGFDLWVTLISRASPAGGRPMVRSVIWSLETDIEKATDEIAQKVIAASWDWSRYPVGMPDAEYDEMMADLKEQEAKS